MIRHSLIIRGNLKIKNSTMSFFSTLFQQGECLKLSQNQHHIYLNYHLSESINQKYGQINEHLLHINEFIKDSNCLVERATARKINHLKVQVSSLDWKIINHKKENVSKYFLQQVTVVWPEGKIPLYYDDINFVVLKIKCKQVSKLDINTTVQFIQKSIQENQSFKDRIQQLQAILCYKRVIDAKNEGYLNTILVNHQLFLKFTTALRTNLCLIAIMEFNSCPTLEQLIDVQKKAQSIKDVKDKSSKFSKLVLIQSNDQLIQNQYYSSQLGRDLFSLSEILSISNQQQQQLTPLVQSLSFEVFINDQNLTISLCEIIRSEQLYSSEEFITEQMKFIDRFANHLLEILFNKNSFHFLSEISPYSFQGKLYIIALINNKQTNRTNKLYLLKSFAKQTLQKRKLYLNKLIYSKLFFNSQQFTSNNLYQSLECRYEKMAKWMKSININKQQQELKINNREIHVFELFTNVYNKEIQRITKWILYEKESTQKICLISSFGSNGKSMIAEILIQRGYIMWRIDMIKLNSPQLTIKNIDFYLEWVFSNTPYPIIFIDNLDSLCSRIQESDQHRKRQMIIAKLVIRKLIKYVDNYDRKLIITAKSEASLDQELVNLLVINLKNPSRDVRVSAMIKVHSKRSQLLINQNQTQLSQRIEKIADNTQSITFSTFKEYAIQLIVPSSSHQAKYLGFSKLAGLKQVKQTIKGIIQKPIRYGWLFKSVPIKLPRGILLYGASGNGKSAIGAAIQDEFKMKYFSVKGSDILSKYIGGSQAAVRDIFEKALSVSPSIVFLDEFQSIVPRRSSNNTGVNDRIVNQFLCYLDGVSSISGVYIIAATSRPDLIDPAVLRPGRLDAHLFLDYPNQSERLQLIRLYQKSVKIAVSDQIVVSNTEHYSYSDLIGLLKQLRIKKSSQVLKMQRYTVEDFTCIDEALFNETINTFKLSVNLQDQRIQSKLYNNFKDGVAPDIKRQRQIQK